MAADFNTAMDLENELWHFALDFYAQPEIEQSCLHLQNTYDLNVNCLIIACWCGLQGIEIAQQSFAKILPWQQEITRPLRAIRQKMREQKDTYPQSYKQLCQAELSCEQVELSLLYESVRYLPRLQIKSIALSEKNLQTYLNCQQVPIDRVVEQNLLLLISVLNEYYVAK